MSSPGKEQVTVGGTQRVPSASLAAKGVPVSMAVPPWDVPTFQRATDDTVQRPSYQQYGITEGTL